MFKKILGFSFILTVFMVFTTTYVSASPVFKDVDTNNSHYDGITYLTEKEIINGYPDGTFKPGREISRSQTAVLLTRALDLPKPERFIKVFHDIDENHQYANQIISTWQARIFKGSNNYFNDGPLTRAQMATVLVNAFNLKDTGESVNVYLDNVGASHKSNVKILAQHGVTNQLDDFRPHEKVTRGQFSTFMYRTMIAIPNLTPVEYQAIKINGKLYGYNHHSGESRIYPYLTSLKELEINNENHIIAPSVIDVRQYSEDTFGTQSGLFNLLQIIVGEYYIVPSSNPFLDGNIQLTNSPGNWGTSNEELKDSRLKLGYKLTYESATEKTIDEWYEYDGKRFTNPISYNKSKQWFKHNDISFFNDKGDRSRQPDVSINELLQYWNIDKHVSWGTNGDLTYIEIKQN